MGCGAAQLIAYGARVSQRMQDEGRNSVLPDVGDYISSAMSFSIAGGISGEGIPGSAPVEMDPLAQFGLRLVTSIGDILSILAGV